MLMAKSERPGRPNVASPSLSEEAEFGGKGIRTLARQSLFHGLPWMSTEALKQRIHDRTQKMMEGSGNCRMLPAPLWICYQQDFPFFSQWLASPRSRAVNIGSLVSAICKANSAECRPNKPIVRRR